MDRLEKCRRLNSEAARTLQEKERKAGDVRAMLENNRSTLSRLQELYDAVETWRDNQARVAELNALEAKSNSSLKDLSANEQVISSQSMRNAASQDKVQRQIAAMDHKQSELRRLLSRLEGHIHDGCCPLCGHDHGSMSRLLSCISEMQSQDATIAAQAEFSRLRAEDGQLGRQLATLRESIEHENTTIEELRRERTKRVEHIVAFEASAASVGVAIDESVPMLDVIARKQALIRNDVEKLEQLDKALQDEVGEERVRSADLNRRVESAKKAITEIEPELEEYRNEIARLQGDHRAAQLSLNTEPAKLKELDTQNAEQLKRIDSSLSGALEEFRKGRDGVDKQRRKISSLKSILEGLQTKIGAQSKTVAEMKGRMKEFGITMDADEADAVRLLNEEVRTKEQLAELRDFADSVEVSIDTATTSAALQQQQEAIRQKERRIDEAKKRIEAYEPWRSYFAQLVEILSQEQHTAITNFTDEYGPMASVIQQRLRAVYGFHGINTQSHESTIHVRVKRGHEVLRPTDYFSHSQQQTLLLGLFLSACMSQTWSSLSTVLLDDPITHFDDLNTYAFLDMLLGLLNAQYGQRQFIISTCDEKVLHLARSKFRHLGQNARFYEFSAIGPTGPVVEEISPV